MAFGEKEKFPFSNDKAFADARFWADLSTITEEVSLMATTKEINKFDYVKEGVRYTIHVEGADGGVMWGTWNCHDCNVGGSSKKSATSIMDAAEAAKSDLEHHHIANHSV
jgi:hypothetical protein